MPFTVAPPKIQPDRAPVCPFFYECGGCDSRDVSYPAQLAAKEQWLKLLFEPLNLPDASWKPIIGSPDGYPIFFRNKIRFSFIRFKGRVWPSRHAKGEKRAEIPVDTCYLQSAECVAIINATADFATKNNWSLYDPLTGKGWLKHLLIRQGKATGELMVAAVTTEPPIPAQSEWIEVIRQAVPEIKSVYHTVSVGRSVERLEDTLIWGEPRITEQVGDFTFHISPHAFFQTNGNMVEALYDAVGVAAGSGEALWDLYAGSATIGTYLSRQFSQVLSIESNESNIEDARLNLETNGVSNLELVPGLVEDVLNSAFITAHAKPDCVIVDPPRAGLHQRLRALLPHLGMERLVYVSCNPATCLRDCLELTRSGFAIEYIQPVDMFPHTWHAEVLVRLKRV